MIYQSIGIYKIINPNGKIYIGQSIHLKKRESRYRNGYCKSQTMIYRSIIKYGWNTHKFEILEYLSENATQKELDDREIYYIKFYKDSGYKMLNLRDGGKEGRHSIESIEKMLKTRGIWHHTEESKLKIRNSQLGKWHHTEETKLKISIQQKGKVISKEQREKQKITMIKKYINKDSPLFEMCENNKKWILNTTTGIYYKGAQEAAIAYNLNVNTLRKRLTGKILKNNTNLKYV